MPTTPNKVKFGLSKAYYAIFDETAGTYGTPVALPGAVSLSLEQQGETSTFRADNIDYWTSVSNNGYEGDLELALIPDSFLTDVMGEATDATTGLQFKRSRSRAGCIRIIAVDKRAVCSAVNLYTLPASNVGHRGTTVCASADIVALEAFAP